MFLLKLYLNTDTGTFILLQYLYTDTAFILKLYLDTDTGLYLNYTWIQIQVYTQTILGYRYRFIFKLYLDTDTGLH